MKFGKPESKAEAIAMCMSSMKLLLNLKDQDEQYELATRQAMEIFPDLFKEELEIPDHPNEVVPSVVSFVISARSLTMF